MVTELLQKYIWLVQTFIRAGHNGLNLDELSDKWERRFDSSYSRRTFNNHRAAIEDVFGIQIACNRSTNRYFIEYYEDVADEKAESAWLINTFTVNNMLSLGKKRLSGRVSVEDIPSGHKYLTPIMEAMTENQEINIEYHKYTSAISEKFTVRPYAVKEVSKRWYLIGFCLERKAMRVYGLDRVTSMELTGDTFEIPKNFDVDDLFSTSFGIFLPEKKAQKIRFRATEKEARFLRDLPIHSSQREISNDGGVIFEIVVCPNTDLIMEFCKYGSGIEVLSPESVRASVAEELKKAYLQYE